MQTIEFDGVKITLDQQKLTALKALLDKLEFFDPIKIGQVFEIRGIPCLLAVSQEPKSIKQLLTLVCVESGARWSNSIEFPLLGVITKEDFYTLLGTEKVNFDKIVNNRYVSVGHYFAKKGFKYEF